jgi:hypothetical protein
VCTTPNVKCRSWSVSGKVICWELQSDKCKVNSGKLESAKVSNNQSRVRAGVCCRTKAVGLSTVKTKQEIITAKAFRLVISLELPLFFSQNWFSVVDSASFLVIVEIRMNLDRWKQIKEGQIKWKYKHFKIASFLSYEDICVKNRRDKKRNSSHCEHQKGTIEKSILEFLRSFSAMIIRSLRGSCDDLEVILR